MKLFKVQLNTDETGIVFIGPVGLLDYKAYTIEISVKHDDKILDMSIFTDIALQYETSEGKVGTYRLENDCLSVKDGAVIFQVPTNVISSIGSVAMQLQLFINESRMTVLNRFMLEVKSILEGMDGVIEEELRPIADEVFAKIENKLDKEAGGTVTGAVDFIGGVYIHGTPLPTALSDEEIAGILQ